MTEGGFHQSLRGGMSVFFEQRLFQGTAVDADPDRDMMGLAAVHHGLDAVLTADVAGVDPNCCGSVFRCREGAAVVKVDIRDDGQRRRSRDLSERDRRLRGWNGDARDLAAGSCEGLDLGKRTLDVTGSGVAHGLDGYRRAAAHGDGADFDLSGHVFVLHFGVAGSLPPISPAGRLAEGGHCGSGYREAIVTTSLTRRTAMRPRRRIMAAPLIQTSYLGLIFFFVTAV